ncbi:MAG: transposase [Solirubrobacterales bacterium]|nr:transposase [Solirubrobacterales bacterium]
MSSSAATGPGSSRASRVGWWLGLTPSLNQSGESAREGAIARTGSELPGERLIEAAWHSARVHPGRRSKRRQDGQPGHVLAIANRAPSRLDHVLGLRLSSR